jgi:cytochrome c biogenesis protein CcmG/thiol:disulfide interchange protein DsbE
LLLVSVVVFSACAANGSGSASNVPSSSLLPDDPYALPAFGVDDYHALLAELRGTPVVVNIWSSWCGPCRREAPELADAAAREGDDVQFLGIDILDDRSAAVSFMKEFEWTYPSVFDAKGAIRDDLGFIGQPDTVFYDAEGRVVSTWSGPLTAAALGQGIAKASS